MDGRLVDVRETPRGIACGCVCPGCGAPLVAKKGEVNVNHFAHLLGADCATGPETSLHMAAKQIVADKLWIQLPGLPIEAVRIDPVFGTFTAHRVFHEPKRWLFDSVAIEKSVQDVRPDVLGYIASAVVAVEIRVTHAVGVDKRAYLSHVGLPCIEVNLSKSVGRIFTFEELERYVIHEVENKTWLFHPQRAAWEAELLVGFEVWRAGKLIGLSGRKMGPAVKDAEQLANERYKALPSAEKWRRLEDELGISRSRFPSYLRVTLREGEGAVWAENDLWQGALFAQFILNKRAGSCLPSQQAICRWLTERFGARSGWFEGLRAAVNAYVRYLRACGFLFWNDGGFFVAHGKLQIRPREPRFVKVATVTAAEESTLHIQWLSRWPDTERLLRWAGELGKNAPEPFECELLVHWLLGLTAPASHVAVCEALEGAGGDPQDLDDVLCWLGVVMQSKRYFSVGQPAPWLCTQR
nr:competence protein CoiA family protein [Roseateles albus]